MRNYPGHRDNEPLRYFGRVPVYAATILAALLCVGMVVAAVMQAARWPLDYLTFSPERFYHHGWVWQAFTYSFVNPPSFFFVFNVFFLFRFGVELEQYFGRPTFLKLYALIVVLPVLICGLWYWAGYSFIYSGGWEVAAGLFIAYAALYPNLEYFGWVSVKYIAFACLAISMLSYFSTHDWVGLSVLTLDCAASFGFIRYAKLGGSVEWGDWAHRLNPFRRRPKFRVLPSSGAPVTRAGGGLANMASVDVILDKIARSGFASLTPDERDQLEQARDILNKKRQ